MPPPSTERGRKREGRRDRDREVSGREVVLLLTFLVSSSLFSPVLSFCFLPTSSHKGMWLNGCPFPSCLKLQSIPSHARGVNINVVNTGSKKQGISHLVVMSSAHPNRSSEGVLLTFPFKNWHVESLPAEPASFRSGSLEICFVNYPCTQSHISPHSAPS